MYTIVLYFPHSTLATFENTVHFVPLVHIFHSCENSEMECQDIPTFACLTSVTISRDTFQKIIVYNIVS